MHGSFQNCLKVKFSRQILWFLVGFLSCFKTRVQCFTNHYTFFVVFLHLAAADKTISFKSKPREEEITHADPAVNRQHFCSWTPTCATTLVHVHTTMSISSLVCSHDKSCARHSTALGFLHNHEL